ncbi:MAG: hypothetical protein EOM87_05115 [Clostridia bacterium]|nr:hypothetical protein [Clostridia bacterium]
MINKNDNKPFIVGIAGGTSSGKSTLCAALEERLSCFKSITIHADSYYKKILPKVISPKSGIIYDDYNHPYSLEKDEFIAAIRSLTKADADIILIDSLFTLYYEETRNMSDFKIFIDLPSDERLIRRIKRNTKRGFSFDEITAYYLDSVRYRHNEFVEPTKIYADLIINGNYNETTLNVITSWVKSCITE